MNRSCVKQCENFDKKWHCIIAYERYLWIEIIATIESLIRTPKVQVHKSSGICDLTRIIFLTRSYSASLMFLPAIAAAAAEFLPNAKFTIVLWNVNGTRVRQQFFHVYPMTFVPQKYFISNTLPFLPTFVFSASARESFPTDPLYRNSSMPTLIIPRYARPLYLRHALS